MTNKGHENIIPPKPGEVRNPGGKKKGTKNRATILKQYLGLKASGINFKHITAEELPQGMTLEEAINFKMMDNALSGDLASIKEIQDTVYGKVKEQQQIEHSFKAMGSIKVSSRDSAGDPVGPETTLDFNVGSDIRSAPDDDEDEEDAEEI